MTAYYTMSVEKPLPWPVKVDGPYKEMMVESLIRNDLPANAVDTTFNNASEILTQCPDPSDQNTVSRKGLMIGKVQSGKTSNFLSLIALSFDNGYKLAIVIGGVTNDLVKQNTDSIRDYFDNNKPGANTVILSSSDKDDISSEIVKQHIKNDKRVILVLLKSANRLEGAESLFDDTYLNSLPVLIIDDEGDQATPNTKVKKGGQSSTYQAAMNLAKHINRVCFISVTATPQANFLISVFDELSPDFGKLITPGEGYCGLDVFHGTDQDRYIRRIEDEEKNDLLEEGTPESFYRSLSDFFVGAAILRSRGDEKKHSMLVHPSQRVTDHDTVGMKINSILRRWKTLAESYSPEQLDTSFLTLRKRFQKSYEDFKTTCDGLLPYELLEPLIVKCIARECGPRCWICNSQQDEMKQGRDFDLNIYVGGNLLQRGMVVKGLTVTYIPRCAKTITTTDTTEQRARWFGYRSDYLDVCRVYMTIKVQSEYYDIRKDDEDLWRTISNALDRGVTFKEIPRILKNSNDSLTPTRKNIVSTCKVSISEGWRQSNCVIKDPAVIEHNLEISTAYQQETHPILTSFSSNNTQNHAVALSRLLSNVRNDFLDKLWLSDESNINEAVLNDLYTIFEKSNVDPLVDVVWMRNDIGEERGPKENDGFVQLLQGTNAKDPDDRDKYLGDRDIRFSPDNQNLILQIHRMRLRGEPNNEHIVLALYISDYYIKKITPLIENEDEHEHSTEQE